MTSPSTSATRSRPRSSSWAGVAFLASFGGIFAAAGLAVLVFMAPAKLRGDDLEATIGVLVVGVLFTLIGFGLIVLTLRSHAESRREQTLRERHPQAPWLWRPEWSGGRIRGNAKITMIVLWCVAGFWNAIAWPIIPGILRQVEKEPLALVGLIFPVVGVGLILCAAVATWRARRFGTGVLTLTTFPGVIGGRFAGQVETGKALPRGIEVRARLACIRHTTTGAGKSQSTTETILWETETRITPDQVVMGPRGSRIPVDFEIPYSCPETDDRRTNHSIHWRLLFRAELPGVDFDSQFDVPVFRTPDSSSEISGCSPNPHDASASASVLSHAKVRLTPLPSGGIELYLPPARNPGKATLVTLCALIFGGTAYGLHSSDAPQLLSVGFSIISALLFWTAGGMWCAARVVRVDTGGFSVRGGLFALGRTQRAGRHEIAAFETRIDMQSGTRAYYSVTAKRSDGGSLRLASGLPEKPRRGTSSRCSRTRAPSAASQWSAVTDRLGRATHTRRKLRTACALSL